MMSWPNRSTAPSLVRAILLLVAAAAGAQCAVAQETAAPPAVTENAAEVDAQLAALAPRVCDRNESLCRHFKAFAAAVTPCLPQGEQLTVGHAYLIDDGATIAPVEYFAVRLQRVGEVTLVQSQHIYSENAEEKQAAEDLVQSIRSGAIDRTNPLFGYLERRSAEVPQLLAQREQRALVVRGEGPELHLRQAGRLLYAVAPDAIVSLGPNTDRREGLLFAVLPAAASCQ